LVDGKTIMAYNPYMLSFSGLIFLLDTVILGLFDYKLWKYQRKDRTNKMVNAFFVTIFILMLAYFSYAVGILFFSKDTYWFGRIEVIADVFLYISFAYGIKIPFLIRFPRVNPNKPFLALLGLSSIALFFEFLQIPNPILNSSGIIHWNMDITSSYLLYATALLMWIPTSYIFFNEGKKASGAQKKRYFLMAASYFLICTFAPLMDVTSKDYLIIISQTVMTIGYILLSVGVLYKRK